MSYDRFLTKREIDYILRDIIPLLHNESILLKLKHNLSLFQPYGTNIEQLRATAYNFISNKITSGECSRKQMRLK